MEAGFLQHDIAHGLQVMFLLTFNWRGLFRQKFQGITLLLAVFVECFWLFGDSERVKGDMQMNNDRAMCSVDFLSFDLSNQSNQFFQFYYYYF